MIPGMPRDVLRHTAILIGVLVLGAMGIRACGVSLERAVNGPPPPSAVWAENVRLASGETLRVRRRVSYGFWFDDVDQSLSFRAPSGQDVQWGRKNAAAEPHMPAILDVVDGHPVVVLGIYGYPSCFRNGFPPEGLVAWRLQGGAWHRMPIAELPATARVNLVRSTHSLVYHLRRGEKEVPADGKAAFEGRIEPPHGTGLVELSRYYAGLHESCASMRPPADPEREAMAARIAQAESTAPVLPARLRSVSTEPVHVRKEEYQQVQGEWRDGAWETRECRGIVLRSRGVFAWEGDARQFGGRRTGEELTIRTRAGAEKKLSFGGAPRMSLQRTLCDDDTIVVLRRANHDTLVVHRFDRDARLLDAVVVSLPRAQGVQYPDRWVGLWTAELPAKGPWRIALVDFAQPHSFMNDGTIVLRLDYEVERR
jgi:hypothetical protein